MYKYMYKLITILIRFHFKNNTYIYIYVVIEFAIYNNTFVCLLATTFEIICENQFIPGNLPFPNLVKLGLQRLMIDI